MGWNLVHVHSLLCEGWYRCWHVMPYMSLTGMTPGSYVMKPWCVIDRDDKVLTWDETRCMCIHFFVRDDTDASININHAWCVIDGDDTRLTWDKTWCMCTQYSVRDDTDASISINLAWCVIDRDDTGLTWDETWWMCNFLIVHPLLCEGWHRCQHLHKSCQMCHCQDDTGLTWD